MSFSRTKRGKCDRSSLSTSENRDQAQATFATLGIRGAPHGGGLGQPFEQDSPEPVLLGEQDFLQASELEQCQRQRDLGLGHGQLPDQTSVDTRRLGSRAPSRCSSKARIAAMG